MKWIIKGIIALIILAVACLAPLVIEFEWWSAHQ